MPGIQLGLHVNQFTFPGGAAAIGPSAASAARNAEAARFTSFWVMDHFFQIEFLGPAEDPMVEGYGALVFAAGETERIKLGTMVTGVTYRHLGLLVKAATTLDVLSGGHAYPGIGAGWLGGFPVSRGRASRCRTTVAGRARSSRASPASGSTSTC